MKMLFALLLLMSIRVAGQEIKVEYDKNHDFSKYKTFSFGENVIVTSTNQKRVSDNTFNNWIRNGISRELKYKGMKRVNSLADLTVSYAFVRTPQSDAETIGPLGMTPGSSERTWSRSYTESTLIIDLNNHSNLLIWRVKGTFDVASSNVESVIDMIIARGFKKYGKGKRKKH